MGKSLRGCKDEKEFFKIRKFIMVCVDVNDLVERERMVL